MDDPKDIMEGINDIFNELQRDAINFFVDYNNYEFTRRFLYIKVM